MKSKSILAGAKINLCLYVKEKRPDGYHEIESLMQTLEFGDTVTVTVKEEPVITLSTIRADLPCDEGNIAYRAAKLMQETFALGFGFHIKIEKHIPIAAGLAGGSTNAAAVLKLIDDLCNLKLSSEELSKIGLKLGADVPYCLYAKPALATGIGEVLTPAAGLEDSYIVLVNPGIGVSTAKIYQALDSIPEREQGNSSALISFMQEGNLERAKAYMKNDMQKAAISECPAIFDLLTKLKRAGAVHAMMSGSGATCFGIFKEKPDQEKLYEIFGKHLVAVTKPIQ